MTGPNQVFLFLSLSLFLSLFLFFLPLFPKKNLR
jgi:hypothetical protein